MALMFAQSAARILPMIARVVSAALNIVAAAIFAYGGVNAAIFVGGLCFAGPLPDYVGWSSGIFLIGAACFVAFGFALVGHGVYPRSRFLKVFLMLLAGAPAFAGVASVLCHLLR
jgi:hypothetical protein